MDESSLVLRLSGTPHFSWLSLGALLIAVGVATGASGDSPALTVLGAAAFGAGLFVAVATLRVSARLSDDAVLVRNWIGTVHLRFGGIAEVGSRVVVTPMTGAIGWGQVELRDMTGRRVPVVASTGLSQPKLERFLSAIRERVPTATIAVDEGVFPTQRSGRRR